MRFPATIPTLRNKCFGFSPRIELLVLWPFDSLYLHLRLPLQLLTEEGIEEVYDAVVP